jgi:hypothetical protein
MKAAVVPAAGAPWDVREMPTPEPGPTQVLIRIRASGLCYTDVHIASGALGVMVAEAAATMLVPEGLAWEQAAPIFCAGYTVWSGFRLAEPRPHERVAVIGIGGLGHLAVLAEAGRASLRSARLCGQGQGARDGRDVSLERHRAGLRAGQGGRRPLSRRDPPVTQRAGSADSYGRAVRRRSSAACVGQKRVPLRSVSASEFENHITQWISPQ